MGPVFVGAPSGAIAAAHASARLKPRTPHRLKALARHGASRAGGRGGAPYRGTAFRRDLARARCIGPEGPPTWDGPVAGTPSGAIAARARCIGPEGPSAQNRNSDFVGAPSGAIRPRPAPQSAPRLKNAEVALAPAISAAVASSDGPSDSMRGGVRRTSGPAMVHAQHTRIARAADRRRHGSHARREDLADHAEAALARRAHMGQQRLDGGRCPGPCCSGVPKPWRSTTAIAWSSVSVERKAWPAALHDIGTDSPMSGS